MKNWQQWQINFACSVELLILISQGVHHEQTARNYSSVIMLDHLDKRQ